MRNHHAPAETSLSRSQEGTLSELLRGIQQEAQSRYAQVLSSHAQRQPVPDLYDPSDNLPLAPGQHEQSIFYSDLPANIEAEIARMRQYASDPRLALQAAREEGITGSFADRSEVDQMRMCVEHYRRTADTIEILYQGWAERKRGKEAHHASLDSYTASDVQDTHVFGSDLDSSWVEGSADLDILDYSS